MRAWETPLAPDMHTATTVVDWSGAIGDCTAWKIENRRFAQNVWCFGERLESYPTTRAVVLGTKHLEIKIPRNKKKQTIPLFIYLFISIAVLEFCSQASMLLFTKSYGRYPLPRTLQRLRERQYFLSFSNRMKRTPSFSGLILNSKQTIGTEFLSDTSPVCIEGRHISVSEIVEIVGVYLC